VWYHWGKEENKGVFMADEYVRKWSIDIPTIRGIVTVKPNHNQFGDYGVYLNGEFVRIIQGDLPKDGVIRDAILTISQVAKGE
jgi:hypothetical protein